jgi:hypothetical protein
VSQKIFQSFWYGDELSPYETACMQSFLDHGHRFVLYTYRDDLSVPAGVELRDAAPLVASEWYFTYESPDGKGSHALFSNLFRYKLLVEEGGWWVDTDVICLSGELPQSEIFCAYQESGSINGAVLRLPKGHAVARKGYQRALALKENARWGEVGPELVTALVEECGLVGVVQPMTVCYPVHYTEAIDLLRPSRTQVLKERVRDALFLHLWNEMFRREQLDKTKLPPAGSLLREIFDRHKLDGWTGEYDRDAFEKSHQIWDLQATLRARNEERDGLQGQLATLAEERDGLQGQLATLAEERDGLQSQLATLAEECKGLRDQVKTLTKERVSLKVEVEKFAAERARLESERAVELADRERLLHDLSELRNSTSWRLTRPLRWLGRVLRRSRKNRNSDIRA